MKIDLCIQVPPAWGRHIRPVIIGIIIVVALVAGIDVPGLPFRV